MVAKIEVDPKPIRNYSRRFQVLGKNLRDTKPLLASFESTIRADTIGRLGRTNVETWRPRSLESLLVFTDLTPKGASMQITIGARVPRSTRLSGRALGILRGHMKRWLTEAVKKK